MKKLFTAFLIPLTLSGCVKEILMSIDQEKDEKKIKGTWRIKKIDRLNNQNNYNGMDFIEGDFNFKEDGTLDFTTAVESYQGTWHMSTRETKTNCYNAPNGDEICHINWNRLLDLDAKKVNGQQRKKVSFESLGFQNDNNFTATAFYNYFSFLYYFERK